MKLEEKDLLLKDLCTRLPYHVRCKVWLKYGTTEEGSLDLQHNYGDILRDAFFYHEIKDIKPYLRPMSSMTEEEKDKFIKNSLGYTAKIGGGITDEKLYFNPKIETLEFLLEYHFDFMGFIDEGLAIKVTEDNNPYND